jgi:uncharacterized oligopeptide transporter (OPT) family protein
MVGACFKNHVKDESSACQMSLCVCVCVCVYMCVCITAPATCGYMWALVG